MFDSFMSTWNYAMSIWWFLPLVMTYSGWVVGGVSPTAVYRLPRGISMLKKCFCPVCNETLPVWRQLPVISWLINKGKCFSCGCSIPYRYPLIEALVVCIWLLSSFLFEPFYALFYSIILTCLFLMVLIDIEYKIIPNKLNIIIFISGIFITFYSSDYMNNLIGMSVAFFLSFGVSMLIKDKDNNAGIGAGDVKLYTALGLCFGLYGFVFIVLISNVMGLLMCFVLHRYNSSVQVPFAPYMACSVVLWLALFDIIRSVVHY